MDLILGKKKYKLSACKVFDSYQLETLQAGLELPQKDVPVTVEQSENMMLVFIRTINISLKATWIDTPFWKKLFYLKYKKFTEDQSVFLLKNIASKDLPIIYDYISYDLNGYKKKVAESPANQ